MGILENLEQLTDRLAAMVTGLRSERDQLRMQVNELRNQIGEKEIENIRVTKENQRNFEILEREKMDFQKEKSLMDNQMKSLYQKLSGLLPDDRKGQIPVQDGRGERRP